MTASTPLIILTIFSLTLFVGCSTKNQPLACFKGSPACYTQQNINTHEEVTEKTCTNCFAVLL
jgi:hypothetical protein